MKIVTCLRCGGVLETMEESADEMLNPVLTKTIIVVWKGRVKTPLSNY